MTGSADSYDAVVVGAGVIGLVTAWRTAQRGFTVALVDPEPGSGASRVSAGMLTPIAEVIPGEEPLLRLGLASRERYPAFVAELEELTGLRVGYRTEGTLEVAFDGDDRAVLDDLYDLLSRLGVAVERLTGRECRRLEPMLAPSVRGGLFAPDDGSVDPRRLTGALLAAAERSGVVLVRERATELVVARGAVAGVRLAGGAVLATPRAVLATGCRIGEIAGLPAQAVPPVRPVKGQILRLHTPQPFVTHTLRGLVHGSWVYVVPREDGEIVVGATQEEMGYDTRVTAGGVWELLRDARELLPGVTEMELTETGAGLRPGTPDNAPVLGPTALPGLYAAAGHFRHGVLLAPVTGEVMAETLTTGRLPAFAETFSPRRFERAPA